MIPQMLTKADACMFRLKNIDVFKYGINPNKMNDYLCAGRPILFFAEGKNNVVEETGCGITVKDNGFGIPSEDIDHIFDRFYRVKNDQTRFITGTGLGLAIVKEIIDAHNGYIRVESEEGKGTTFYTFIPIFK